MYLSGNVFIYLRIYPKMFLSIYVIIRRCFYLSTYLSEDVFIYLRINLKMSLSATYLSKLSVFTYIYLKMSLNIYLCIYLMMSIFIYLSTNIRVRIDLISPPPVSVYTLFKQISPPFLVGGGLGAC